MTISDKHITVSRFGATMAVIVTTFGLVSSIIGVGIYLGGIQSVNAEQTKQIDQLKVDQITKREFDAFKEDVKGLLQTYTSQISKLNNIQR